MAGKLDNVRLAKSALTDQVYIGIPRSDGKTWTIKKDITNDFISAVIDVYGGYSTKLTGSDLRKWEIVVKEIT